MTDEPIGTRHFEPLGFSGQVGKRLQDDATQAVAMQKAVTSRFSSSDADSHIAAVKANPNVTHRWD